jgi:hypothetical protein
VSGLCHSWRHVAGAGEGGAEAPAAACLCTTNEDCERDNGVGWTCVMDGGCFGGCWRAPPTS